MPGTSAHLPVHAVTHGPKHHFFGYYDKSPWDASGRYLVGLEAEFADRPPRPEDAATVGLIDTAEGNAWKPVAQTRAWNWQQGNMLQWLPSAPDHLIVYNARQGRHPVAVVMDAFTGRERVLPRPIYAVSPTGEMAVSLSFARLADTRPGYGYSGLTDPTQANPCPEDDGLFRMDLDSGESRLIVSLAQLAAFQPPADSRGAKHWVNHVQFSPRGTRFAFLHRWRGAMTGAGFRTRLLTSNPDGSGLRCVSDHEMVSHYDWRDEGHLLAWARRRDLGDRYFLFEDGTGTPEVVGEGLLTSDGHCSYSPDRRWILTDTYPDGTGERSLLLYWPEDGKRIEIGRFFSPQQLSDDIRCDLHPRWSRDGRFISFDSAHEDVRRMYVADVGAIVSGRRDRRAGGP
ncbi:MAG: hypothetical protein ACYS1C_01665 [Planctomycetota bacterium]|jgi:hypothetical protein